MRPAILADRDFRRYFVGRSVSYLGDLVLPVALAFAVLDVLGGGPGDLGLVLAAETVPLVLFVLFGGALADRLPPRSVMIGSDIVRAAVQLTVAVAIFAGNLELWHLVVAMLIHGAAQALFHPSSIRMLPMVLPQERLQEGNAVLSVARNVSRVGGPTLAALLIAVWGVGAAVLLDGITFVISMISLALISVRTAYVPATTPLLAEIRTGWREFRARRWVWSTTVYFGLYQALALAPYLVLGPTIAEEHLGGAGAWAAIVAASGLGAILGGVAMVRVRPRFPLRFACIVTFLEVPALLLLGMVAPLAVIVVAWFIAGVTAAVWTVLWETTLQEHIPEESLGRVSAYDWFISAAANPLSYALVGFVAAAIGAGVTLVVSAVALAGLTLLLLLLPDVRRLGRAAPVAEPG